MHKTLKNWLLELEKETVIVSSSDINQEANENMVTFGFSQELLKEWEKEAVVEFLTSCKNIYNAKNRELSMVFYSWFDEQSNQIRISAVSQEHGKLPFECKLNSVNLNEVVLGIYTEDSGLFSRGVLDVYQQSI